MAGLIKPNLSPLEGDIDLLKEWMLQALDEGKLPLHNNTINREALQGVLDLPTNALRGPLSGNRWEWLRSFLDRFDEYLAKKAVEDLNAKLHHLWQSGELPLYRGTVSRMRLAELTYLPAKAAKENGGNWADKCINEFNIYLRQQGQGTVWEVKVPAIRAHLQDLHNRKLLPINQAGKLNRVAILTPFGLSDRGSPWVIERRAPLLKELLDEYDRVVLDADYSQFKYDFLESALRTILEGPEVPLNRGRTISIVEISKRLGVRKSAIRATPSLRNLIQQKQKQIDESLRRGTTKTQFNINGITSLNLGATPWSEKHKRIFDFSCLIEPYSLEFAEKVGTIFIHVVAKLANAKSYYSDIRRFLLWLPAQNHFNEIIHTLNSGKLPEKDAFERAFLAYQQVLFSEYRAKPCGGSKRTVPPSFTVISRFSDARLFPHIAIPSKKREYRTGRMDRNSKPTLVEAQVKDAAIIKDITEQAALYRGIAFDTSKDTIAFVNTLAFEKARRDDLPYGLVEAISFLCEERLYELKKEATKVFREWHTHYLQGRTLIAGAIRSGRELREELQLYRGKGRHWKSKVAELFPEKDKLYALSNILAVVEQEFNGVCPNSNNAEWGQFWGKTYSKLGGARFVQMYMLPPSKVVSAAVCLYLCESGTNCSVGLALEPNCIRPSKLPAHVNIVSTKARSKGKSIFSDLPAHSGVDEIMSAFEALKILRDVTQPLRNQGVVKQSEFLVFANNASIRLLQEWQFRSDVKAMVKTSDIMSELTINPSMIRPTVLLHAELKNPGSLSIANIIAQHKSDTTTMGYVNKLPFRVILEDRIRGFMDTLQVVIASSERGGHRKLGFGAEQTNLQIEHSKRTGLGVFCANPFSGVQIDYPAGKLCKAVDRCIECSQRIVVAHDESIADMIIWQEALSLAQEKWLEERYQRWEEVWTPWQAFFHVVLNEKMTRGELAVIKKRAAAIAEKRKIAPNFILPEPW